MKRILFRGLLLLMLVSVGISVSDVARGARSYDKSVQLITGKADTVELSGAVTDVLVANPAVADVGTLRSNRLYIVGKSVGDTNVLAYDDAGNQLANIVVHVRMDDKNLQDTLKEFFPDEKISVRTIKNNIVLSGSVSSASVSNQVRDLASHFLNDAKSQTLVDLMKVDGEQQVMLKVRVVEASRAVLKELGLETNVRAYGNTDSAATTLVPGAGGTPLGHGPIDGTRLYTNDIGRTVQLPFGSAMVTIGKLTETINALERDGIVNTLAEPNLTAISGETAGFLAGGEFPVPSGRDSSGNVTIDFKQFGVALNFTPTVLSKERIALHMSAEVSAQDASVSVTLANVQIPGLSVRRTETTVELGSGSTIMIAGLLKSNTIHSFNGYPGVDSLPIIGQLFKSRSFRRDESELLFIVTPYLVNSFAEAEATAIKSPTPAFPGTPASPPALEKPTAILPKTGNISPIPASMAQTTHAENTVSPLSQSFMNNLRKVYGDRVVEKVGTGAGFGYIVE